MYTKIIDDRFDFKTISFSNYKIKEIKKDLVKFINNCDIEKSCFFTAELICSGLFIELWNIIIEVIGKNISNCNIKIICYLELKFNYFKEYINSDVDELELRNSENIRELFCEIITILCLSNKVQTINRVKIKGNETDYSFITSKLIADKVEYASAVYCDEDPKELFIAINELIYCLHSDNPNQLLIYFWIEWILKYYSILKKNNKKLTCKKRDYPVTENNKNNIIFIIWDCIKTKESDNKLIEKCIDSLINLFCIKYSPSCNNKRIFLLYLSVKLLISKNNLSLSIINNKDNLTSVIKKNDYFYKKIKQNEVNKYTGGEPIDEGNKLAIDRSIKKLGILYGN